MSQGGERQRQREPGGIKQMEKQSRTSKGDEAQRHHRYMGQAVGSIETPQRLPAWTNGLQETPKRHTGDAWAGSWDEWRPVKGAQAALIRQLRGAPTYRAVSGEAISRRYDDGAAQSPSPLADARPARETSFRAFEKGS